MWLTFFDAIHTIILQSLDIAEVPDEQEPDLAFTIDNGIVHFSNGQNILWLEDQPTVLYTDIEAQEWYESYRCDLTEEQRSAILTQAWQEWETSQQSTVVA